MQIDQLGKRAQNKEKVKLTLIEEATKLFASKGLEKTTVADIVKAAKIGRGTFYNYFTDVRDIFNEIVDQVNEQIRILTQKARVKQDTVHETLYATFKAYFDLVSSSKWKGFHEKNQAHIRSASYKSETIRRLVQELREDVNKASDTIKFTSEQSKLLLSYVLIGTPAELYLNNMSVNKSFDNDEVARFLATLFTSGILAKS